MRRDRISSFSGIVGGTLGATMVTGPEKVPAVVVLQVAVGGAGTAPTGGPLDTRRVPTTKAPAANSET